MTGTSAPRRPAHDALELLEPPGQRNIALFLDYDGTLTPLVDDPSSAVLDPGSRSVLRWLAGEYPVIVVSGRDTAEVRTLTGVSNITYAGSHGHEIEYQDGTRYQHPASVESLERLHDAETRLRTELGDLDDVSIERKGFAVAVHTRLSSPASRARAHSVVGLVAGRIDGLVMTSGKEVREIRPDLDWNKGTAIEFLLKTKFSGRRPIFIGDDVTDEDGFEVVRGLGGITVIVGPEPDRETAAEFELADPPQVIDFLGSL